MQEPGVRTEEETMEKCVLLACFPASGQLLFLDKYRPTLKGDPMQNGRQPTPDFLPDQHGGGGLSWREVLSGVTLTTKAISDTSCKLFKLQNFFKGTNYWQVKILILIWCVMILFCLEGKQHLNVCLSKISYSFILQNRYLPH
jgi:hypothetical protein